MIELLTIPVVYALHGLLGGALYVLVVKYGWTEKEEILRKLAVGAIGGYVVFIAGLPDSVTAMTVGYMGVDVIEAILNKFRANAVAK